MEELDSYAKKGLINGPMRSGLPFKSLAAYYEMFCMLRGILK